VLTRQQLYELYWQGPDVVVRLIEDLYEHLAATEPPEARALRLTVASQLAVIKRSQGRLKRLGEKLAHQECLNYALERRLSGLGALVGKDSHNSSLPPSSGPPGVRRTRSLRRPTGKRVGGQPGHRGRAVSRSPGPTRSSPTRPPSAAAAAPRSPRRRRRVSNAASLSKSLPSAPSSPNTRRRPSVARRAAPRRRRASPPMSTRQSATAPACARAPPACTSTNSSLSLAPVRVSLTSSAVASRRGQCIG
jgi:Family of unknown function (DUF6444)